MEEKLVQAYRGVVEFNSTAKSLNPADAEGLRAQAKIVLEEAKELLYAVEHEGEDQVLKEASDLLVTAFGMLARMTVRGYDVLGAMNGVVNPNNMTKFCLSETEASYTCMGYNATEDCGAEVKRLDEYHWGVFNSNGKLLKPMGYSKVKPEELKSYLPKGEEE